MIPNYTGLLLWGFLQFSIVSSSSGLWVSSLAWNEGRSSQRSLPVQDHFCGIDVSEPTQNRNFRLNSLWEQGLRLQILTHFMADQLFVLGPCKWVNFYPSHLLLKSTILLSKSICCIQNCQKSHLLSHLSIKSLNLYIPEADTFPYHCQDPLISSLFVPLVVSFLLPLGEDVHLKDAYYMLLMFLVFYNYRILVSHSHISRFKMPFRLHRAASVKAWGKKKKAPMGQTLLYAPFSNSMRIHKTILSSKFPNELEMSVVYFFWELFSYLIYKWHL